MVAHLSKKLLTYSNGTYQIENFLPPQDGILLPAGGNYRAVIHDQFSDDGKDRIGMPEVWPLWLSSYSELTEAWQWYWFRVGLVHPFTGYETWDETELLSTDLDRLKAEWRSLTHSAKALTNNAGTDTARDYISHRNLSSGDLPKQGDITFCGNVVRILGDSTGRGTPIETLDGSYPPPSIEVVNRLTRPDLLFAATNVAADKSLGAGKWKPIYFLRGGIRYERVDPFPNVSDVPGHKSVDTLASLRTNGRKASSVLGNSAQYSREYSMLNGTKVTVRFAKNYIDTHRLATIDGNFVPTPYVLP